MDTPCYNCVDRTVGCHACCDRYHAYKKWHAERKHETQAYPPHNWESRDIIHYSKKAGRVVTVIRKEGRY